MTSIEELEVTIPIMENLAADFQASLAQRSILAELAGGEGSGAFAESIGNFAESQARTLLQNAAGLVEELEIQEGVQAGPKVIDFGVKFGEEFVHLEAKYSLPRIGTAALDRLLGQAAAVLSESNTSRLVVWSLRSAPSSAITAISEQIGMNSSRVVFVSGITGLYEWVKAFVGQ